VNDFLSGGIRPLDLTEQQILDLVAFMEALTSPEFADLKTARLGGGGKDGHPPMPSCDARTVMTDGSAEGVTP
jgi:hypothetical protein